MTARIILSVVGGLVAVGSAYYCQKFLGLDPSIKISIGVGCLAGVLWYLIAGIKTE
jgi:hypothetical protein